MDGSGNGHPVDSARRLRWWGVLLALVLVLAPLSAMADVAGSACVEDGDTLAIGGKRYHGKCRGGVRVRLHGIDAPELEQTCADAGGAQWHCGRAAASMLLRAVRGHTVACDGGSKDAEGNLIAVCRVGGKDLAAHLARMGVAVADRRYSDDYVDAERAARAAGRGIWRGPFALPWDWRAGRR